MRPDDLARPVGFELGDPSVLFGDESFELLDLVSDFVRFGRACRQIVVGHISPFLLPPQLIAGVRETGRV